MDFKVCFFAAIMVQLTEGILSLPPRISEACRPACRSDLVCLEFSPFCTYDFCQQLLTCIAPSQLPSNLRSTFQEENQTHQRLAPSPGCPRPSLNPSCLVQCQAHSDCGTAMLCCNNGCGQVCTQDTRVRVASKRGTCPRRQIDLLATDCLDECRSDSQCPGLGKCCQGNCGRSCVTPCFHWLTDSYLWRLSPQCSTTNMSRNTNRRISTNKRSNVMLSTLKRMYSIERVPSETIERVPSAMIERVRSVTLSS